MPRFEFFSNLQRKEKKKRTLSSRSSSPVPLSFKSVMPPPALAASVKRLIISLPWHVLAYGPRQTRSNPTQTPPAFLIPSSQATRRHATHYRSTVGVSRSTHPTRGYCTSSDLSAPGQVFLPLARNGLIAGVLDRPVGWHDPALRLSSAERQHV
jgi:hypothetical protein